MYSVSEHYNPSYQAKAKGIGTLKENNTARKGVVLISTLVLRKGTIRVKALPKDHFLSFQIIYE
ncbi:MAG: hypothetical protein J7L78_02070 [Dehalococcoidales bacterium]|nr:hypothetical protein [Dehalococcoidales bacterium]